MQESIQKYKNKITEKWNETDKASKIKLCIIAAALILALLITVYLTMRPSWVVFTSNSDAQTIGQLQNAFDDAGIDNNVTKNATAIEIKQKDLNQARLLIAQSSNITKKGFTFEDALNANNMGMSESDKKEIYLRAYEDDIGNLIETIDGIDSAEVKLVLPDDSAFFENDKQEASASITVYTSRELTKDQALTIARLVAMGVKGLDMKNIEITDQNANSLYSGSKNTAAVNGYSSKEDVENQKKNEIEMKVRAALSKLYDDVNIMSTIKIDWNKRQEKNITYTPPIADATEGLPKNKAAEEEEVVNGQEGDEPGVAANDQNPANYQMGEQGTSSYSASKLNSEYLYNSNEVVMENAIGEIVPAESSISVIVYNYREYDEALLREQGLVDDENNTWAQFKADNAQEQPIEIYPNIVESISIGTGIDIDRVSVVGYEKPVFVDMVVEPLAIEHIIMLAILAILLILLAFGLIKKTRPDEVEEVEPELSVEDLLVSTQMDEKKEEEIAEIDTTESEYKKQIEKFVDEQPEAVAQLLRNWLSDEWE